MDPAGLDALADAVRQLHRCEPIWVESVRVTEVWQGGEIVWQGEVHVFEIDHPSAKRAYAWSDATGEGAVVAVLALGPVTDAATAVRAWITAGDPWRMR